MQNAGRLLPPTSAAAMETPAPQQLPVRPALPQLSASRGGVSFNTVGTSRSPPKLAIPGDSGLRYHASPPPQHLTDAKNRGSPLSSARVNGPSTPYTADSLPTLPACTLRMGAMATSFEFHPVTHTLLLAGTAEGNVSLLALAQQEPLFDIPCRTQNLARGTPVKRVTWSPDSCAFGAAFASCKGRGIIHLYNFKVSLRSHSVCTHVFPKNLRRFPASL